MRKKFNKFGVIEYISRVFSESKNDNPQEIYHILKNIYYKPY